MHFADPGDHSALHNAIKVDTLLNNVEACPKSLEVYIRTC